MRNRTGLFVYLSAALCVLPSVARAETWSVLTFEGRDDRLFTADGDWRPGDYKAECGGSSSLLGGVSTTWSQVCDCTFLGLYCTCLSGGYTQDALCISSNVYVEPYQGITLDITSGDDRLDTSLGDWSYGNKKAECARNQVITGLAQNAYGVLQGVRCSASNINHGVNCSVLNFNGHDDEESNSRGDWSPGYWKAECSPGRYMKGIAIASPGGPQPLAALCCSPSF
jgi:hypothetical protein